jgi:hypothetical protein
MIMLAVRMAMPPDWLPMVAYLLLSGGFQA